MSFDRQETFGRIVAAIRASQLASDLFDQAVADRLGLNRTDFRAMDALSFGPLTPGQLAAKIGLSPGAVTTAIDRLERAGYARRRPDPGDRRRVLVEIPPEVAGGADDYYGGLARGGQALLERYSDEQLATILDFLERGNELSARELAQLKASQT